MKENFEKRPDFSWIDKEINRVINNIISKKDLDDIYNKVQGLENGGFSAEGMTYFLEKTKNSRIDLNNLAEFKYALEKLSYPKDYVAQYLSHENAHANTSDSIGAKHLGYSIIIFNDNGDLIVRQITRTEFPANWSDKDIAIASEKIATAPELYEGQKLSEGDNEMAKRC
jgi:hypothetical protein